MKTRLNIARDGMELMLILKETVPPPPDVIFLDLNMPRKSGFECLEEINQNQKFSNIPVVVFSTSSQPETIERVYENGARYYIRKPGSFPKLKLAIEQILSINWQDHKVQTPREEFFLAF